MDQNGFDSEASIGTDRAIHSTYHIDDGVNTPIEVHEMDSLVIVILVLDV